MTCGRMVVLGGDLPPFFSSSSSSLFHPFPFCHGDERALVAAGGVKEERGWGREGRTQFGCGCGGRFAFVGGCRRKGSLNDDEDTVKLRLRCGVTQDEEGVDFPHFPPSLFREMG